jgi:hypothetical protein
MFCFSATIPVLQISTATSAVDRDVLPAAETAVCVVEQAQQTGGDGDLPASHSEEPLVKEPRRPFRTVKVRVCTARCTFN